MESSSLLLRPATLEDLDKIHFVETSCFSTPWSKESLEFPLKNPKSHCTIVAILDNRLVGYGALLWVLDEGEITNIGVLPAFRQQKIGHALLLSLLKKGQEEKLLKISLEVRSQNIAACGLYKKAGFSSIGMRKNYYKNPSDHALLMQFDF